MTLRDDHAIYPGSFDPVTRGHLDIARRGAALFSRLHVAVVANPAKAALFSIEERLALLRGELDELIAAGRVEVGAFSGLAVQLAGEKGARWILRGLRSSDDAAFELSMALSNRRAGVEEVETVLLPASPETSFIASRLVREIAAGGGELSAFVTPRVEKALREKLR
jgi:pantetheine-phosphate adenylyltransferase